ncbi:MAG: hypothetical protein WBS33_16110 [Verrucomicrobiia bacterium]
MDFIFAKFAKAEPEFPPEYKPKNKLKVMSNEFKAVLDLAASLPTRVNKEMAAKYLGFKGDDITILIARGLLKPLGRPVQNSDKYFAKVKLIELGQDAEWLSRATLAVSQHWKDKNARKSKKTNGDGQPVE